MQISPEWREMERRKRLKSHDYGNYSNSNDVEFVDSILNGRMALNLFAYKSLKSIPNSYSYYKLLT